MGKIEEEVKTRARKQNIQRAMLSAIGIAGLLAVAMVAPNTLQLLKYTPLGRRKATYRVNDSLDRLLRGGYVVFENQDGKKFLRLTKKGESKLATPPPEMCMWHRRGSGTNVGVSLSSTSQKTVGRHAIFYETD